MKFYGARNQSNIFRFDNLSGNIERIAVKNSW